MFPWSSPWRTLPLKIIRRVPTEIPSYKLKKQDRKEAVLIRFLTFARLLLPSQSLYPPSLCGRNDLQLPFGLAIKLSSSIVSSSILYRVKKQIMYMIYIPQVVKQRSDLID